MRPEKIWSVHFLANEQIDKEALTERITRDIRIGEFAAGSWLKQADLQQRYDVSRILVRRTLDELASRRIVEHLPNRGYRVCESDRKRRAEFREVLTILECHAAKGIVDNITDNDIAHLKQLAERFATAADNGSFIELDAANFEFHQKLAGICANRYLGQLISDLRKSRPSTSLTAWRTVAQLKRSSTDHFLIVEALTARDAAALATLIRKHINEVTPLDSSDVNMAQM